MYRGRGRGRDVGVGIMANTGTNIRTRAKGGIVLPAPKIRITGGSAAWTTYDLPALNWAGGTIQVQMQPVTVSVYDLPSGVKVQLELERYSRRNAGINAGNGQSGKYRGWVHSSHGPNPANGNWTRGGEHSGTSPAIKSLRQTEWSVVNTNVIDVTQSMLGFIASRDIAYRSPAAAAPDYQPDLSVQGISTVANAKMRRPGKRFAYAPAFHAGLFRFRYSIADTNDSRSPHISGPESEIVAVSTEVFPFIIDPVASSLSGKQMATISPVYDPARLKAWVGPTVRLP